MSRLSNWGKLERASYLTEERLRKMATADKERATEIERRGRYFIAIADNLRAAREDVPPYLTMDERLLIGQALRDYATHGPGETSEETCELLAQRVEVPIRRDHVQALGRGIRPEPGPLNVADDWLTAIQKWEGQ